jgi:hypothetical protein
MDTIEAGPTLTDPCIRRVVCSIPSAPTRLEYALRAMEGRQVGARIHADGSARLQWPDEGGRIPAGMLWCEVASATLDGETIEMYLRGDGVGFVFRFDIGDVAI